MAIIAVPGPVSSAYQPGNIIDLTVQFTDTGLPTDPPGVTLQLTDPSGASTVHRYPGSITRTGVGSFSFDLLSSTAGWWVAVWSGGGAATPDVAFTVLPSRFS